jgi:hypothetical protein
MAHAQLVALVGMIGISLVNRARSVSSTFGEVEVFSATVFSKCEQPAS